jgi:hypothetical protein
LFIEQFTNLGGISLN